VHDLDVSNPVSDLTAKVARFDRLTLRKSSAKAFNPVTIEALKCFPTSADFLRGFTDADVRVRLKTPRRLLQSGAVIPNARVPRSVVSCTASMCTDWSPTTLGRAAGKPRVAAGA